MCILCTGKRGRRGRRGRRGQRGGSSQYAPHLTAFSGSGELLVSPAIPTARRVPKGTLGQTRFTSGREKERERESDAQALWNRGSAIAGHPGRPLFRPPSLARSQCCPPSSLQRVIIPLVHPHASFSGPHPSCQSANLPHPR
jgi:hypothetical protein